MNRKLCMNLAMVTGSFLTILTLPQVALASTIESTIDTAAMGEPIAISYGDHTVNSGISPKVDVDGYSFQGKAGDSIRIVTVGHSNYFDPVIELRGPGGAVIQTQSCSVGYGTCSINLDQTLSSDGTHYINISDVSNNESGSYTLHLDQYRPANNWDAMTYDNPVTDLLGHGGDHDFFAFNGTSGTGVRINVAGNSNYLDPWLQVWDPSGTMIVDQGCGVGYGTCSFFTELAIASTGIYTMGLFDAGFSETGSYSINVACTFGSCPTDAPSPVPLPAAFWLFGSGMFGLLGYYQRKIT